MEDWRVRSDVITFPSQNSRGIWESRHGQIIWYGLNRNMESLVEIKSANRPQSHIFSFNISILSKWNVLKQIWSSEGRLFKSSNVDITCHRSSDCTSQCNCQCNWNWTIPDSVIVPAPLPRIIPSPVTFLMLLLDMVAYLSTYLPLQLLLYHSSSFQCSRN